MEEKIKDGNPKRSVLKYILNSEIIFDDSRRGPLTEAAYHELHQTKKTFFRDDGDFSCYDWYLFRRTDHATHFIGIVQRGRRMVIVWIFP